MKKLLPTFVAVFAFTLGVLFTTAFTTPQQNAVTETAEHPRIAKAITQMEDAIAYMEAAPHDFGGHKAAAIADTKAAVKSLKLAMAYRAKKDNGK
jgi:hypothetical protein